MVIKATLPDHGEPKRYLVQCDDCSFERTADGRDRATDVGTEHHRETGHTVVAVEMPKSMASL